jgi:streptogramin lyase
MWKIACRQSLLTALVVTMVLGGLAPAARAQTDLLVASQLTGQVLRYDGATGASRGVFIAAGSGGLALARGLAVGPDGYVYLGTESPSTVLRFDAATGAFVGTFVSPIFLSGGTNGFAWGPNGVFYLASFGCNCVIRYNATTGALIDAIIGAGSPLSGSTGVQFGPDGNLYVGSFNTNQVLRFNPTSGAFIDIFATVPTAGAGVGGIVFGPDGNLYVGAFQGNDVLVFNGTTGALLGSFIPAADPHPLAPIALRFGPDGNLYVTAQTTDEVKRYNGTTGAFIDNFVSAGSGGLDGPFGFAFIPRVLDADSDNVPDGVDNCPMIANTDQADVGDGDGVGDLCDNCTEFSNVRVPGWTFALGGSAYLAANPWATLTGGQRDDDHDGFGNICDGDFDNSLTTTVADTAQYKASIGNAKVALTCGTPNVRPCAIFDLNSANSTESSASGISAADTARYKLLIGSAPGPNCAACTGTGSVPLPCEAGTAGACN